MVMFNSQTFIQEKIKEIKNLVGNQKALVATSGGVDSSTCAVLAHRALGENMEIIFLDDGLMREGEGEEVRKIFKKMGLNLKIKKVASRFFKALKGIEDPEEKRITFRSVFYKALSKIVKKEKANYLIQGTIAADVVTVKKAIKTHHNVLEQIGIDPKRYGFSVIEPLRDLYKPEVRKVAQTLGLPKEIFERMAFPGPGFAVRVIGEVTPERVALVGKADKIVKEEIMSLRKDPEHPYQAFAVLMKDKSTGMLKEKRVFGDIIVVRVFDSKDAMTATPTDIPRKKRARIVKRITEELPSVVRVLFDETPKPPSRVEFI